MAQRHDKQRTSHVAGSRSLGDKPPARVTAREARALRRLGFKYAHASEKRTRTYLLKDVPTDVLFAAQQRAYAAGIPFKRVLQTLLQMYAEGKVKLPIGKRGYPSGELQRGGRLQRPTGWYQPGLHTDDDSDAPAAASWQVITPE